MSDEYQFSIRRTQALVLAGCFAAVSVLLFFAGTVTGLLYSGAHANTTLLVSAPTVAARPHSAPDKSPYEKLDENPESPTEPSVTSSTASPSDEPIPGSSPATTAPAPAAATPSPTPSTDAAKTPPTTAALPTKPSSTQPSEAAPETTEASLTIPLAVQVGAFAIKANAETLVQSLGDMGYKPVLSRSTDARGHLWYVVKVGPYTQWNSASRVAARISMTEDVTPVIGPMR